MKQSTQHQKQTVTQTNISASAYDTHSTCVAHINLTVCTLTFSHSDSEMCTPLSVSVLAFERLMTCPGLSQLTFCPTSAVTVSAH